MSCLTRLVSDFFWLSCLLQESIFSSSVSLLVSSYTYRVQGRKKRVKNVNLAQHLKYKKNKKNAAGARTRAAEVNTPEAEVETQYEHLTAQALSAEEAVGVEIEKAAARSAEEQVADYPERSSASTLQKQHSELNLHARRKFSHQHSSENEDGNTDADAENVTETVGRVKARTKFSWWFRMALLQVIIFGASVMLCLLTCCVCVRPVEIPDTGDSMKGGENFGTAAHKASRGSKIGQERGLQPGQQVDVPALNSSGETSQKTRQSQQGEVKPGVDVVAQEQAGAAATGTTLNDLISGGAAGAAPTIPAGQQEEPPVQPGTIAPEDDDFPDGPVVAPESYDNRGSPVLAPESYDNRAAVANPSTASPPSATSKSGRGSATGGSAAISALGSVAGGFKALPSGLAMASKALIETDTGVPTNNVESGQITSYAPNKPEEKKKKKIVKKKSSKQPLDSVRGAYEAASEGAQLLSKSGILSGAALPSGANSSAAKSTSGSASAKKLLHHQSTTFLHPMGPSEGPGMPSGAGVLLSGAPIQSGMMVPSPGGAKAMSQLGSAMKAARKIKKKSARRKKTPGQGAGGETSGATSGATSVTGTESGYNSSKGKSKSLKKTRSKGKLKKKPTGGDLSVTSGEITSGKSEGSSRSGKNRSMKKKIKKKKTNPEIPAE
ncbi:unnamed protein product [Amoebophrya sp. A120]|nr:unnamed protein product [Amoebophrya sp. A120]|eukprot:GSA120T00019830001.1